MAISISTKQILQWVGGIITALLLASINYTVQVNSRHSQELQQKVDRIYDYATNHEVRMKVIEDELADHRTKILDLQLAQERLDITAEDINKARRKNETNVSSK